MQWIAGATLREKINRNKDIQRSVKWIMDLCGILYYMHRNRYQHRDLKPENIQITPTNEVYLLDFNITLKTPNKHSGTPAYAAPEMLPDYAIVGNDQVDIFSIGKLLYELLAGVRPMHQEHYYGTDSHSKEWSRFVEPKEINPQITDSLNEVIIKCMKLNPTDRYLNAQDLKNALYIAKKNTIWQ